MTDVPTSGSMMLASTAAAALASPGSAMLSLQQYEMIHKIAESAANAGLARSPDEAFVKMVRGHELGLPLMTANDSIRLIEGRLSYDATLMEGLAVRQPTTIRFECVETTDERCVYRVQRQGWDEPKDVVWTIADAERAGLLNRGGDDAKKKLNNWNKYPAQMLRARCKSDGARLVAPEALHAMYSFDEVRDDASLRPEQVTATVTPRLPAADVKNEVFGALMARVKDAPDAERPAVKREIKSAEDTLGLSLFKQVVAAYQERWPAPMAPAAPPPVQSPAVVANVAPAAEV
jgi:hypothetical protein